MKYGINLLLWGANIGEAHYPLLENIKKWGFDGVEIPTFGPDEPRVQEARQEAQRHRPPMHDLRDRAEGDQPGRRKRGGAAEVRSTSSSRWSTTTTRSARR